MMKKDIQEAVNKLLNTRNTTPSVTRRNKNSIKEGGYGSTKMSSEDFNDLDMSDAISLVQGATFIRGQSDLVRVINAIGYPDMEVFFGDNPGVLETIIDWISNEGSPDWLELCKDYLLQKGIVTIED